MGRPPLEIGTFGSIRCYQRGGGWVARTNYRDYDGVTRPVERTGRSKTAAERNLKAELSRRSKSAGGQYGRDTRFGELAEVWFAHVARRVADGQLEEGTGETYRRQLDRHVLPALRSLRLHEVTTPRVDSFLQAVKAGTGAPTAKTCRSVVSGVMGYAVRIGAADVNPVREVERLTQSSTPPRAMTTDERTRWLAMLASDPDARAKDLPDLTAFMLGTGARIGEALAVSWDEVDLSAGCVLIRWKLVRITGKGLLRIPRTKTHAGLRSLPLPGFLRAALRRRALDIAGEERESPLPVFPHSGGGWRDPRNTRRDLRDARGAAEFAWVTSHVFRKTCATILDEAGMSAREIADQLGHARPSITQDVYMGRQAISSRSAEAIQRAFVTEPAE